MHGLLGDLRFALRLLARAPGYTAVAALTIALAIGANTAMFSVVSGVLIKPLPYRDPDRLVLLHERSPTFPEMSISHPDLVDWRKQQTSFEAFGAYRNDSFNLTGVDRPERLDGIMMSASLLPLLGIEPELGRHLLPEEDRPGGTRAVMISHGLWQRRFGGDREVVGRTIALNAVPHAIVGVLPPAFSAFDPNAAVVVSLDVNSALWPGRGHHPGITAIARLKAGVSFAQARADMEAIGDGLRAQYNQKSQVMPALVPLHERLVRDVRPTLLVLMGAVGFVLLIAVANVANLMLARGTTRRKEMAIRAALGAGRGRLVRQLLVESAVLSLAGGGLGVLLALWGVDLLAVARPRSLPTESTIAVDLRVLAFSVAAALAAGLLAGLLPALAASKTDLARSLKEGDTRTTSGGGHPRLRAALVVAEIALSLVLLVGAGLSIQGFVRLARSDLGYRPNGLLTMSVTLPRERYADAAKLRAFLDQLEARVAALPGVEAASLSSGLPIAGASEMSYWVEGRPQPTAEHIPFAVFYPVGPGYHAALGIPIRRGRGFDARDGRDDAKVVIVDERLASVMFGSEDPIGKRIVTTGGELLGTIVGVVPHVVHYGPGQPEQAPAQLYIPFRQIEDKYLVEVVAQMGIVARTALPPATLTSAIVETVRALDPDLPVHDIKTMDERVTQALGSRRFAMTLLVIFAALALALAVVGLYAVMSYLVTQRTHEIGIRMALGAQPRDVQMLVLGQGLRLTGVGLGIGLLAALALTRLMASLLYGVTASDPATYAAVTAGLGAVALLASFLPARRATRVDPMIALRYE